eukprot:jgi/Tetstr1/463683/TSEL_008544.t1
MRFCLNGPGVTTIVPKPGLRRAVEFKETVRKLCGLSDDTQLDLSFQCSDPQGQPAQSGKCDGAYDAAVHSQRWWAENARHGSCPANVIDNPATPRQSSAISARTAPSRTSTLWNPESPRSSGHSLASSDLRRSNSTPNANGISDPASSEPTSRVRLPSILRGFQKKISDLTSRALPAVRSSTGTLPALSRSAGSYM